MRVYLMDTETRNRILILEQQNRNLKARVK